MEADEEGQHEEADQADQQAKSEQGLQSGWSPASAKSRRSRFDSSRWENQRGFTQDPSFQINAESRAG